MELTANEDIYTRLKENIISWYPFEPNAKILKVEKEWKPIGEEQYDYVILLGTLELEEAKKHVKEKGKILLAIHNKMGIKNYCQKQQEKKESFQCNRKQIQEQLQKSGFNHYKFYYVLPDYETTNAIFTDAFFPNQETLARNIFLHNEDDILLQSENQLFLDLLEQNPNLFQLFANSYLIECSKHEFPDNQIKFVSFSNMRKEKYGIKTIVQGDKVYKTAGNEQAKEHIKNIRKNIETLKKIGFSIIDSYEKDVIISQYQEQESFDNTLLNRLKEGKKEEVIQLMTQFFQEIKEKLGVYPTKQNIFDQYGIKYEKEQIENLTFTKYGLWDLIFQNAFYINGKIFFYDQEWMEEGMPIEYIFYRSIQYTQKLKEELEEEAIFTQLGITKQHLELFMQLDNKLQEKIRNNEVWTKHMQGQTVETLKEQIEKEKQEREKVLEDCKGLLNQKDARICFLEENMDTTVKLLRQKENEVVQKENEIREKENKIVQMENSISWKLTKPLRIIRKKTLPK